MASLVDAVLGDPTLAMAQREGVPAYEETHAEVQNVLLPPGVPRGLSFQVLQSVNKHVALTHRRVARGAARGARRVGACAGAVLPSLPRGPSRASPPVCPPPPPPPPACVARVPGSEM